VTAGAPAFVRRASCEKVRRDANWEESSKAGYAVGHGIEEDNFIEDVVLDLGRESIEGHDDVNVGWSVLSRTETLRVAVGANAGCWG
jgi:hypothetical protein